MDNTTRSSPPIRQGDKAGYGKINNSLNICVFEEYLKRQKARLSPIANVDQLNPRVLRVLGQNEGQFTLQGTNTYIVGTGRERLIIDTSGGEPEWAELLVSTLECHGISLSHVLLTHCHGDHVGGVPELLHLYPHLRGSIYKNEPESGQQSITDGQIFHVEGATIRAIHVPGHSTDHMCFILEEEQAMFTGDNILGHGTTVVQDLGTFMTTLEKMEAQNCTTGYPAHGVPVNNLPAKIARELSQKRRRETQVMQALDQLRKCGQKSTTVDDLVTEIYGLELGENMKSLALVPFMKEVLQKLAGDGRVGFQVRSGRQKWYSLEAAQEQHTATPGWWSSRAKTRAAISFC